MFYEYFKGIFFNREGNSVWLFMLYNNTFFLSEFNKYIKVY